MAVRLLLLTGVRGCELRQATPEQFDLERGLWIIPPEIGYPKDWVDAQLSHADPNKTSAAYNHAEYSWKPSRLDRWQPGTAHPGLAPQPRQARADSGGHEAQQ